MVSDSGTLVVNSEAGTMIINHSDDDTQDDDTMKKLDTDSNTSKYRPGFLDYFDQQEKKNASEQSSTPQPSAPPQHTAQPHFQQNMAPPNVAAGGPHPAGANNPAHISSAMQNMIASPPIPAQMAQAPPLYLPYQRSFLDTDFEFLQNLSYEDLQERLTGLEPDMESEIEELLKRYHAKRQPILDAIDAKKKRQQNF